MISDPLISPLSIDPQSDPQGSPTPTAFPLQGTAELAAGFTPLGTPLAIKDSINAFQQGDNLTGVLAGLGAIPFIPNVAGVIGRATSKELKNAVDMASNGVNRKAVRDATGVDLAAPKNRNKEFDTSSTAIINKRLQQLPMDGVSTAPLFAVFPDQVLQSSKLYGDALRETKVAIHPNLSTLAEYNHDTGTILLRSDLIQNPDNLRIVLEHEVNHVMQKADGLETNPAMRQVFYDALEEQRIFNNKVESLNGQPLPALQKQELLTEEATINYRLQSLHLTSKLERDAVVAQEVATVPLKDRGLLAERLAAKSHANASKLFHYAEVQAREEQKLLRLQEQVKQGAQ